MIGFTDDHVVNKSFRVKSCEKEEETITVIEDCMKSIKSWKDAMQSKMNSTKTKIYILWKQEQISKCKAISIHVNSVKNTKFRHHSILGTMAGCITGHEQPHKEKMCNSHVKLFENKKKY